MYYCVDTSTCNVTSNEKYNTTTIHCICHEACYYGICETLCYLVISVGMDEGEEEVVPLPNVNAAILKKVVQWCTYHKDDPPLPDDDDNKEKRTDDISSWDADFLKVTF